MTGNYTVCEPLWPTTHPIRCRYSLFDFACDNALPAVDPDPMIQSSFEVAYANLKRCVLLFRAHWLYLIDLSLEQKHGILRKHQA